MPSHHKRHANEESGIPDLSTIKPNTTISEETPTPDVTISTGGIDIIAIRGAAEHNLQSLDIDLPRNKLIVFTGVSGSGKSSLAFDTIYAEGQRRYVESLSSYARQFLGLMQKPEVRSISGLSPAISIDQKSVSRNPRSTVGTVTEIYDYLRLLFAHVGVPYSPATGLPISSQTPTQIVDAIQNMGKNEPVRLLLNAPIARQRKGTFKKELDELVKLGFRRFYIDGKTYEPENLPKLTKNHKHEIFVTVDRLQITPRTTNDEQIQRLTQSVETALEVGQGTLHVHNHDTNEETLFSEKFSCPVSGFTISELKPRLFSFNAPFGACANCSGLGNVTQFDIDLVIPDPSKSIAAGAVAPWSGAMGGYYNTMLKAMLSHYGHKASTPYRDLPEDIQHKVLHGTGQDVISMTFQSKRMSHTSRKPFEGVIRNLERRLQETTSEWARTDMARFQKSQPCRKCNGQRLNLEALSVRINDLNIAEFTSLDIAAAVHWIMDLPNHLTPRQFSVGDRILQEIRERLTFLLNVGLGYLTLSRSAATLSGGESQRIRLASQIGSGLAGVLYVLDEPSIGLHQHDNERLLSTLARLRDLGNSLIVVEHDEDTIRAADHVVDIGPMAGIHGGKIVAQGKVADIISCTQSLTGDYLSGRRVIQPSTPKSLPEDLQPPDLRLNTSAKTRSRKKKDPSPSQSFLSLTGARGNNLQNVDLHLPLGKFSCVTGVSGSGKSSLLIETLQPALLKRLRRPRDVNSDTIPEPLPFDDLLNTEQLDKIIVVDQAPIGRTPRSNPATYTGIMNHLRDWYASLPESQARGYKPGRFSFNVKGGRCETCKGDGSLKVEMHFLPDVMVKCDQCNGLRYNRETLDIRYRTQSIADVLNLSVDEALQLFDTHPRLKQLLSVLQSVGLGYIRLGQSATTLSGGEAQRIKLSKELSARSTSHTLYIFDEPTTGLHFEDVRRLVAIMEQLTERGHTVLVIEHHLDMIKCADWVVDLGPGGGKTGGQIVACGSPSRIAQAKNSLTGRYLRRIL